MAMIVVEDSLKQLGFDPVSEAVKMIHDGECPPIVRAKLICELLQYVYPKLKSVELTGDGKKPIQGVFDFHVIYDE